MEKKKVLVWETLATVSGGQKMTLTVMDMLSDIFEFCCLIPAEEYPLYINWGSDSANRYKGKKSDFSLWMDVCEKYLEVT